MATLTHLSQNSGSLPDGQSFVLMPESRVLEDPLSSGYSQPLHVSEPPQRKAHMGGQMLPLSRAVCPGWDELGWSVFATRGGPCLLRSVANLRLEPVFVLAHLCHC